MWDIGWDSLVPKVSPGQLGGYGTWDGTGWYPTYPQVMDSSQGVTASPTYADHIRAELTQLSPLPARRVPPDTQPPFPNPSAIGIMAGGL